jgi:choline-sulfatase
MLRWRCEGFCASTVVTFIAGLGLTPVRVFAEQPNFVFFCVDQLRSQEVGCYGNAVAQTPEMDALAAAGVRFEYAVPGLPVCTPSRACMLTGRMPYSVRSSSVGQQWMVVNTIEMDTNEITIAEELNPLGYLCGHVGEKWHVSEVGGLDCIPNRQGFTFFEGLNSYGGFNYPLYCDNNRVLQTGSGWTPDVMTDRALNFMTANQDRPFFLNVWLCPPHAPGSLHWGQYHDPLLSFDGRKDLQDLFASTTMPLRPNVPSSLSTEAKHQLREYDGLTTGIDQCLGRILDHLATLGIADRTIIIVSSDHGSQLGSHATAFDTVYGWEKNEIYDESILVPLIVRDPRHAPPTPVVSSPVHQMDLLPTILELVGGPPPERAEGRSFAPLITGTGSYQQRDAVLVQYNTTRFEGVDYGQARVLRTNQWKYAVMSVGGNLVGKALFDLQADPDEMNNLIDQPAQATTQAQLHARILAEMIALHDPLVTLPPAQIDLSPASVNVFTNKGINLPNGCFTITNPGQSVLNYSIADDAAWLGTQPESGTCPPEQSVSATITYATGSLAVGDYLAVVTVRDPEATNSPQQLNVHLRVCVASDFDLDGDVDLNDFTFFRNCLSGVGVPAEAGCEAADLDADADVDQVDFGIFQRCLSGNANPPDPNCAS